MSNVSVVRMELFTTQETGGKEKAFEVLRNRMIEERLKVITELQNQIEQLRALTP